MLLTISAIPSAFILSALLSGSNEAGGARGVGHWWVGGWPFSECLCGFCALGGFSMVLGLA